jgi:hypothetical protein
VVGGQLEHGGLGTFVDIARMLIGTQNEQSTGITGGGGKLKYVGGGE